MRQRTLGVVLVVLGLVGMIGTAWGVAATSYRHVAAPGAWAPVGGVRGGPSCSPSSLPGQIVDVELSDMGGMMSSGRMMSVSASSSSLAAGQVSFRVWNAGMMTHELIVLPLPTDGAGTRPVASDGRVSEAGSLGEASKTCGEGTGDGIDPGAASWTTLQLSAGRYELICNFPGHYATGMFMELDVR